jgi:ubiquinone/menaquinone biosynthesis C-methylase UbiE
LAKTKIEASSQQLHQYCIICGSNVIKLAFIIDEFVYYRCSSCHSLFIANRLTSKNILKHYSQEYFEAKSYSVIKRRGYSSYKESQNNLDKNFTKKLDLIRKLVSSGDLLDAGAAYGFFLRQSKEYFNSTGLEISPFAISIAKKEFGLNINEGNIEKTNFPDGNFDLITMWDIIEHLVNPFIAVKEVFRILKPGGFVFISTDDSANWLPRLFGRHWWAIGPPMHICHFSKQGILDLFNRVQGFDIVDMVGDKRNYSIPEIVKHFGVSYSNEFLIEIGSKLDKTFFNQWDFSFQRPEQFIFIARKIF